MTTFNKFDDTTGHLTSDQNIFDEALGHIMGTRPFSFPASTPIPVLPPDFEPLPGWNELNVYEIVVDPEHIDETLAHFPLPVVLDDNHGDVFEPFLLAMEFTEGDNYIKTNGGYTSTKAGGDNAWDGCRNDFAMSEGTYYWEKKIDTSITLDHIIVGVSESDTLLYPGSTATTYGYRGGNGQKYTNGSSAGFGDTFTTGDVIGFALDLDNGKIWFSKNGVWQGPGDPDPEAGTDEAFSGLTGEFYAGFGFYNIGGVVTLLGQNDQVYDAPEGYTTPVLIPDGKKVAFTTEEGVELYAELVDFQSFGTDLFYADEPTTVATASSYYSSNYLPYKLFDGSFSRWVSNNSGAQTDGSCWIQFDFPEVKKVKKIRIAHSSSGGDFPEDIKVYGSATGTFTGEETHMGDYTMTAPTVANEYSEIVLDSVAVFMYLRIEIHTQQSVAFTTSQLYLDISEVQFEELTQRALYYVSSETFSISQSIPTKLYLYYDMEHADNTEYVGEAKALGALYPVFTSDGSYSASLYTRRIVIETSVMQTVGDTWTINFMANATDWDVEECWIGFVDTIDGVNHFDGDQVQVTMGDSNSFTITESNRISDPIDFIIDGTKEIMISVYHTTTNPRDLTAPGDGYRTYYKFGNVAADDDPGAMTSTTNRMEVLSSLDLISTPANNVWDSDYEAVFNMAQDPSGSGACMFDSTANGYSGTPAGTMLTEDLVDAPFGKAIDFDGTDDLIDLGDAFEFSNYATIEVWAKPDELVDNNGFVSKRKSAEATGNWTFRIGSAEHLEWMIWAGASDTKQSTGVLTVDVYNYLVASYDDIANELKFYFEGALDMTSSDVIEPFVTNSEAIKIGFDGQTGYFDGQISSLRMSSIIRSAAWLKAAHYGQLNQLTTIFKREA